MNFNIRALLAIFGMTLPLGAAPAAHAQPAQQPWTAECVLQRQASLPFAIKNGHVLVEVSLNGIPRHFFIDTGGFISSVTEEVAKAQNLKTLPINDNLNITGLGAGRTERYAIADTMAFGKLAAKDVRLLIVPAMADGEDGIIGPEYLRNFDLDFDFAGKTLNFFKPHRCADHVVYWGGPSTAIPLTVTGQGHIQIPASLDGTTLETEIDTGSPVSLIGAHTVLEKFQMQPEKGTVTLRGGSGGTTTATDHRFGALVLGDFTVKNPPLLITEDEVAWRSDDASLLLGLRELRMFHVYIAYRERKMYLTPLAAN